MTFIFGLLGGIGTVLGLWYGLLGLRASSHLLKADQIDKAVGWSLWWCLDAGRYDEEGQRMCRRGQLLAFSAAGAWILAYAIGGR